jgi:hypothetical protein
MVARDHNSSYSRSRSRRIIFQGWPRQKCETLSEKQTKEKELGVWLLWYSGCLACTQNSTSAPPNKPEQYWIIHKYKNVETTSRVHNLMNK